MHQWGYGPVNTMWGGQEWWFGQWPLLAALFAPVVIVVAFWSVVWKGLALWHSARRGEYWWFVILLIVNTLGILEIIYLFFVAGLRFKELFSTHSHGHNNGHDHRHGHDHSHNHNHNHDNGHTHSH